MRYLPPPTPADPAPRVRSVAAKRPRPVPTDHDAQLHPWRFGDPRRSIDPNHRGSHAGLEHIKIPLFLGAVRAGYVDVHLHHNRQGLSVGATLCLYTAAVVPVPIPPPPPEPENK